MISFGAKRGVPVGKEGVGEGRGCWRRKSNSWGSKGSGLAWGADWEWSSDWSWRWGVSHHSQRKTQVQKLVVATMDSFATARGDFQSENGVEGDWRSREFTTRVSDLRVVCTEVGFKILN